MVLGAPVGSLFSYSINMLLGLELGNYFGKWEGYLVGVSLVTLVGLMIGTREGCFAGLILGVSLGSPLESKKSGSELPATILGAPLGLWFVYEVVSCLC